MTIPALDASSRDACLLTLKIAPEFTRMKKASGRVTVPGPGTGARGWLASNFRLAIDGLDTTKVSRIEAFTVAGRSSRRAPATVGPPMVPGKLDVPDLDILLPEAAVASWSDWFDDFVIAGNNDETHEKSGTLTFLGRTSSKSSAGSPSSTWASTGSRPSPTRR